MLMEIIFKQLFVRTYQDSTFDRISFKVSLSSADINLPTMEMQEGDTLLPCKRVNFSKILSSLDADYLITTGTCSSKLEHLEEFRRLCLHQMQSKSLKESTRLCYNNIRNPKD